MSKGGDMGGLERIAGRWDGVEFRGRIKYGWMHILELPSSWEEKHQRLWPRLNAKLHLLKLNLAHIRACFLAPSKSMVHSLSLPPSLMQSPLPSSTLQPFFLSLFDQYPKRKFEAQYQFSLILFFFSSLSLSPFLSRFLCHFLCVQALATWPGSWWVWQAGGWCLP